MLLYANIQLVKAQEQVQEVDQRTQEIMDLVGQQWTGSVSRNRGPSSRSADSTSKVEIFMDPRTYDGSKLKFEDWWTKMQAWLDCNSKQFSYINADGGKIINEKNYAYIIFSCFKEAKGSHFVEVELQKLAARDICLHN